MRWEEGMIKTQKTGTGIEKKSYVRNFDFDFNSNKGIKNIDFTTQYFVISLNWRRGESGKTKSNRRWERHKNGRHYYYYYYYNYYYFYYYYYYYYYYCYYKIMEKKMGGEYRT